jgi:uncharacterized protein YkwD
MSTLDNSFNDSFSLIDITASPSKPKDSRPGMRSSLYCSMRSLFKYDQDAAHELVNDERVGRGLEPFVRSEDLDDLAYFHVQGMGSYGRVFHSVKTVEELKSKLSSKKYAGENVKRGYDITDMHNHTMGIDDASKANILSKKFTEMGVAYAIDEQGRIYVCQLFRKRRIRSITPEAVVVTPPCA